jgi:DNA-binding beta-propeller fold protein YncE
MPLTFVPHFQNTCSWLTPILVMASRFTITLTLVVFAGLWPIGIPHALAYEIANLQFPQNIIADDGQVYYIANANGDPGTRENKGFISKADKEGKITALHFIQGGQDSVTLHSPKEMAIIGSMLYVADLDVVRGFKKTTGRPLVTIPFSQFHAESLTGLTADSHGLLYVSDADTNTIFQIDPAQDHAVTQFIQDAKLSHPHGLAVHPHNGHLMGVGWDDGKVFEIDEQGILHELFVSSFFSGGFHNLDGIDFDRYGIMYISDLTAGKVWRIRANLKKEAIAEFLLSPSGIGVDRVNHLILVPYLYAKGAEINGLERPSNDTTKKKKRTFSDYGLDFPKKDKANE